MDGGRVETAARFQTVALDGSRAEDADADDGTKVDDEKNSFCLF